MQPTEVFPTADLIACANRELGFRKSCYPKWAKVTRIEDLPAGKQREIEMMAAIPERLRVLNDSALALQAFKDYVHTTLDKAGVDKHEEQNATTGCRVGARLADLIKAAAQPALLADAELAELARQGTDLRTRIAHHSSQGLVAYLAQYVGGGAEEIMEAGGDTLELLLDVLPSLVDRVRQAEAKTSPAGIWSNGDFLNVLVGLAKAYRLSAQDSIARNCHMHDLPLGEEAIPDQSQIDAVLTNFLNHVGVSRGMDLGLYSSDLVTVKGGQPNA